MPDDDPHDGESADAVDACERARNFPEGEQTPRVPVHGKTAVQLVQLLRVCNKVLE